MSTHTTSRYVVTVTTYRLAGFRAGRACPGSILEEMSDTVTCDFCGAVAPTPATLTWTTSMENGRLRRFCDTCSRTHLRSMEGKLDSSWW